MALADPPAIHPQSTDCCDVQELKRRGWTPTLIKQYLGQYDYTRRNPGAAATRLYLVCRVEHAEANPAFVRARERAAAILASARDAAAELAAVTIKVEQIDFAEMEAKALSAWGKTDETPLAWGIIARVVVHHVRDHLVTLGNLGPVLAKVNRQTAKHFLLWRTLEAIADAYPDLAEEAERQAWEHWPDGVPDWLR